MEQMLSSGFERIGALVEPAAAPPEAPAPVPTPPAAPAERLAAVERCSRLLALLSDMPDVIDQAAARERLAADLALIAAHPLATDDLVAAYVALITARLAANADLTAGALRHAVERLRTPIDQAALTTLAAQ
jgi:hypothetical protein